MALPIKMEKIKTSRDSNKEEWRARRVKMNEVGTKELAQKIQDNCSLTKADVLAVLCQLSEQVGELLKDGHTVVLDGLGRFHLSVESNVVEHPSDFDIQRDIRKVKCKFTPEAHRRQPDRTLSHDWTDQVDIIWAPDYKPKK